LAWKYLRALAGVKGNLISGKVLSGCELAFESCYCFDCSCLADERILEMPVSRGGGSAIAVVMLPALLVVFYESYTLSCSAVILPWFLFVYLLPDAYTTSPLTPPPLLAISSLLIFLKFNDGIPYYYYFCLRVSLLEDVVIFKSFFAIRGFLLVLADPTVLLLLLLLYSTVLLRFLLV
jgi:hypothetical protein